jgi:predicted MFS family arabinose efflux permease
MMLLGLALTGVGDITVGQIVSRWIAQRRGLALGLVYVGSNLGGVLLVPLAVALAERTDWRTALLAMGTGAIVVMLPISLLLIRDSASAASAPDQDATESVEDLAGANDLTLREALRTRSFWILFYALFAFFFYFLALLEHLVLFLTDEGMPRSEAVAAYAIAIGLGIWSKLGLGLMADRIPAQRSLLIVYSGLAASSIILLALPESRLLWAFVASFGFSYAARDVVYPLIITSCFGLHYMAQIYGALMIMLVMGAVGPWFAAGLHDRTGSYDIAFQVFAVLNVVAVATLFGLRDERLRRSPR